MRHLQQLCFISAVGFLVACGGGGGTGAGGGNTPAETATLADVQDQSVNLASVEVIDGRILMTTVPTGANPIGQFLGAGIGNKAIASFDDHHRFPIAQLSRIIYEAKSITGSNPPYLNLMVDLDCVLDEDLTTGTSLLIADIRNRRKIILVETFAQTALDDGYVGYTINATDSNWLAVGGAGGLPGAAPGQPLSTFVASFPDACIINGAVDDPGLGRAVGPGCQTGAALSNLDPAYCGDPYNGIAFVLGDSTNLAANQWNIRKITVNNTDYQ
ncbi:MAG: hypothetical protein AB7N80_08875 [Bdellovibrionales bacterium]